MANPITQFLARHTVSLWTLLLFCVFAINASAGTQTVLWSFGVAPFDGDTVYSTPVLDASGNVYGTTLVGGTRGFGTAFRLSQDWRRLARNDPLQLQGRLAGWGQSSLFPIS